MSLRWTHVYVVCFVLFICLIYLQIPPNTVSFSLSSSSLSLGVHVITNKHSGKSLYHQYMSRLVHSEHRHSHPRLKRN